MQFVTFELTHESFYCPVTGVCLQHEDVDKLSSTDPLEHPPCQAFWVDEVIGDCMSPESFKDSAFGDAWEKWSESFGENGWDVDDFRNLLKNYHAPNWCAFEINVGGPNYRSFSSYSVWYVIDLNYGNPSCEE